MSPNLSHYMDIVIQDGHIHFELHARLLFIAHQLAGAEVPVPCAVDSPGYHRQHGLGFIMRVFAPGDVLEAFQLKAMPLINTELVEAKPIHRIPEQVARFVRCTSLRDVKVQSRSENPTPSWMRREIAFRQRKGHADFGETEARELWRKRATKGGVRHAPFVQMRSFSNATGFRLYIDRRSVSADAPTGAGKGYGLGYVVPDLSETGEVVL